MSELKQVKVDNWGIYFLQRLKHFFNRTDYCDLTLQFRDNAQLKVHRLVLNACTEYFEVLERTCEMYEDCLVMPEDLQADVVVPIVNFMYTGQLEFRMGLLEKLYQTSLIMKMPVLTKLLKAHRATASQNAPHCYVAKHSVEPTPSTSNKRSYGKAFDTKTGIKEKKVYKPVNKSTDVVYCSLPSASKETPRSLSRKTALCDPKPTRYELPEELDGDGIFDSSFTNISYTSKPLMIHPEAVKHYTKKRRLFNNASINNKDTSTLDIVECKKNDDNIFEDNYTENSFTEENEMFQTTFANKSKPSVDSNRLFDQILDQNVGPKIMIDTKNSKVPANLDHAKIISEVLKKYSHLLKGSKNIKLKILNTPNKKKPTAAEQKSSQAKIEKNDSNLTYETDVIDSKQAAKLIAMGAENVKGPWICLICGTPGKALHFMSYYKFRRHLVEVHNEKPVVNICEYCGHKVFKRNHLLFHLYTKHGVDPPPQYHFPKCDQCDYVGLTEGALLKHKLSHSTFFQCNVCSSQFNSASLLLQHMQKSGHKYSSDKKSNIQCVYCLRKFIHENALYNHLKSFHKSEAKSDGILEDSDEEKPKDEKPKMEREPETGPQQDYEEVNVHYQIQPDGNIHVIPNGKVKAPTIPKHKILNPEFSLVKSKPKPKENTTNINTGATAQKEYVQEDHSEVTKSEDIVIIDGKEYILKDNQLIPRATKNAEPEYIISDMMPESVQPSTTSTSQLEYTNLMETVNESNVMLSKSTNLNQPIQFVVSNEEEYKALMSSNHPIIFDNGDSNKTLAVLSNHGTSLETTSMELDNTQQNDMMIIQENYPLNVTESVVQDNSNIVVVYSHPVDSSNKQFQILTSQGTQLIQSSAIITQNFETVTTTAPIMDTHVIASQNWENEITPMTIPNASKPDPEIETTEQIQPQAISHQSVIVNNMSIIPEVQVPPKSPSNIDTEMDVEETIKSDLITDPIQDDIENPTLKDSFPIVDLNNTSEGVIVSDMVINEQLTQVTSVNPTIDEKPVNVCCDDTNIGKSSNECIDKIETSNSDSLVEKVDNVCSTTFTQETDTSLDNNGDAISQDSQEEILQCASVSAPIVPKAVEKNIQILTSEWSEDEYDSPPATNDNKISPIIPKDAEEKLQNLDDLSQTTTNEKSMENEILTNEMTELPTDSTKSENSSKEVPKIANDKITSLLSDWEDSQEDVCNNDENVDNILPKEYEDKLRNDSENLNLPKVETCVPTLGENKNEDLMELSKEKNCCELTNTTEDKSDDIPNLNENIPESTLPEVNEDVLSAVLPEINNEPEKDASKLEELSLTQNDDSEAKETPKEENETNEPLVDETPEKPILNQENGNDNKTDKPDEKIKSLVSDWDDDDDDESKIE